MKEISMSSNSKPHVWLTIGIVLIAGFKWKTKIRYLNKISRDSTWQRVVYSDISQQSRAEREFWVMQSSSTRSPATSRVTPDRLSTEYPQGLLYGVVRMKQGNVWEWAKHIVDTPLVMGPSSCLPLTYFNKQRGITQSVAILLKYCLWIAFWNMNSSCYMSGRLCKDPL